MIEIFVNDQGHRLPAGTTVAELITRIAPHPDIVAAVNGTFVPRSRHAGQHLQTGDRVELLSPMEGG